MARRLVEAGADAASRNGAGKTAVALAVHMEHWECAEALVTSPGAAEAIQVWMVSWLFCMLQAFIGSRWIPPDFCISLLQASDSLALTACNWGPPS